MEDYLKRLGYSIARGVPQAATGFVDLAALPFTMSGMIKPEDVFLSTDYLTQKGLLPKPEQGLLNQTTELLSSAISPAAATKGAILATGGLLADAARVSGADLTPLGAIEIPKGLLTDKELNEAIVSEEKQKQVLENNLLQKKINDLIAEKGFKKEETINKFRETVEKGDFFTEFGRLKPSSLLSYNDVNELKKIKKSVEKTNVAAKNQTNLLKNILQSNPEIKDIYKNRKLKFTEIEKDKFKGPLIYKSPVRGQKQSSEYRLINVDGKPAFARKSNHFGIFTTNVYEGSEDAEKLFPGEISDQFGRVGAKTFDWSLEDKGLSKSKSKAGYILLEDLEKQGKL
tara:strand:+ start:217 stop:1245 length:1029 start_codon:yes stop_codon:yes gene_type:complete